MVARENLYIEWNTFDTDILGDVQHFQGHSFEICC